MVKEIEKYGIPIVHMATITTISQSVGANRIVPTVSIPYPVGNPSMGDKEPDMRLKMTRRAVEALGTGVEESTIFKV